MKKNYHLIACVILFISVFGASLIASRLSAPVTDWVQPMVQDAVWEKIRESVSASLDFLPRLAKGAAFGSADAAVRSVVFRIVHTVLYIVGFIGLRFVLMVFVRPLTRLFNHIPLVGGIKEWVDAEYESGRVTMITPHEVEELVERLAPGRFAR